MEEVVQFQSECVCINSIFYKNYREFRDKL